MYNEIAATNLESVGRRKVTPSRQCPRKRMKLKGTKKRTVIKR